MISFIKNLINPETLDYSDLLERGAIIIDVRTPQEFAQGHADSSINIPLGEFMKKVEAIKRKNKPVITCCRSGARSGSAAVTLKSAGVEAYNGGSWNEVQRAINNRS